MMRIVLALLLLPFAAFAEAEGAQDCAWLKDREARLACFDRFFPGDPEPAEDRAEAPEVAESPARPDGSNPAPLVPEVQVLGDAPVSESPPAAAERPAGSSGDEGGLFNDPPLDLTSTIVTIRRGEKQNMVFLLENDQVWMQATPRPLPFREGDRVTIRNAKLGGYFMRSERGTATRVKRIH